MGRFDKIEHLIKLLEAESEEVRKKVRLELERYGQELRHYLDAASPQLTPEVMYLLEEMIRRGKNRRLRHAWLDWLAYENEYEQLEAALTFLAGLQDPLYGEGSVPELLDLLVLGFLESKRKPDPLELNHYLFVERRLCGAVKDYHHPQNSNLAYVLREGRGLPISLVCVLMLAGFRLGIRIQGFNLPGHFLARAVVEGRPVLFDCFHRGKILAGGDIAALVRSPHIDFHGLLNHPPSTVAIVTRVLANLCHSYRRMGDLEKYQIVGELKEDLQAYRESLNTVSMKLTQPDMFRRGQLVIHRRYGYRGVVVDYDKTCQADEAWYRSNQTQPDRDQPWYHVLVDGSNVTTYSAHSNLVSDPSAKEIRHPLLKTYFHDFRNGYYVRNEVPWTLH